MEFAGIITLGEIVDGNKSKWTFTSNKEIVELREGKEGFIWAAQ